MGRPEGIDDLAEAIRTSGQTIVLSGAGISTPSGIPDFRGDEGIWNREFDPLDFHRRRFDADSAGFWTDRVRLRERLFGDEIEPNPAHIAVARLESKGHLEAVITQNTDGLHRAAGSDRVVELHGNASRVVCIECGRLYPAETAVDKVGAGECPPTCGECDGILKPDVVLFGETLPTDRLTEATTLAAESDLLIAVGTSLQVQPAASLPTRTLRNGGRIGVINLGRTPFDDRAAYLVQDDVTNVLPRLADRLE